MFISSKQTFIRHIWNFISKSTCILSKTCYNKQHKIYMAWMKRMGEDPIGLPKEQNSQVLNFKQEPYADTTLESPLNGRRRCKDVF